MLVFHLKKQWFEKIKSGEKTHEYRLSRSRTTYLNQYIKNEPYKSEDAPIIRFDKGYPKITDKSRQLFAKMKSCTITNGLNTDLKVDECVYDIEFELI